MNCMGKKDAKNIVITKEVLLMSLFTALFLVLTVLVVTENAVLFKLDKDIAACFYSIRNDGFTNLSLALSFAATWKVIAAECIVLLVIPATRMKVGIPVSIVSALAVAVRIVIKLMVMRPRPDEMYWLSTESDSSFPSGHSCGAMAIYGFLAYLVYILVKNDVLSKVISALLLLLAVLIGLSRIYLGMHYPSDVLGGFCLALIVILVCTAFMKKFRILTMKEGDGNK